MAGPYPYPDQFPGPQQQIPVPADAAQPYPQPTGSAYPGMLPPPVPYPKRRRWRVVLTALIAVVVVVGAGAAVVLLGRGGGGGATAGGLTDASARVAIQGYLDALADGDHEAIARHSLCGMFDEVKQRRSDLEVANLNSDAFRKQFDSAEVTNIDKMVRLSVNQARVLFSMDVVPTATPRGRESDDRTEVQGIAELLYQDDEVLVCNYLVRTGSQY